MNCGAAYVRSPGLVVAGVVAGGVAIVLGAVVFAGCGGGAQRSSVDGARATATAFSDLKRRLGLAEPTATPDVSGVVRPREAAAQLAKASPRFAAVLDAVAAGDVDAFLRTIEWKTGTCGMDRGYTFCPSGTAGEQRPLFKIGGDFAVTAEALRPSLNLLLKGAPLALTYAAQSKEAPSRYYVGFESATSKGKGILPVTESDVDLWGMLLTLDAAASYPVAAIDFSVSEGSSALDRAGDFGFET